MYIPGRWRMCSASLRYLTLSDVYSAEASAVACSSAVNSGSTIVVISSLMVAVLLLRELTLPARRLFHHAGAEAQVGYGCAGQAQPELLQQSALVKTAQLLKQDGVAHRHLQHAAPQRADARLGGMLLAGGFLPGSLQM